MHPAEPELIMWHHGISRLVPSGFHQLEKFLLSCYDLLRSTSYGLCMHGRAAARYLLHRP